MSLNNIKIFLLLLSLIVLSSCSMIPQQIGGKWRAAYDGISTYFLGYPDYPITREMIDEIPYASLRMKIGNGPAGILILQEINNDLLTWISADDVIFSIRRGRIVETHGLLNDLTNLSISIKDEEEEMLEENAENNRFVRILSLSEPEIKSLKINVEKKNLGNRNINILGKEHTTVLIEETVSNNYIKWNFKNYYWIEQETGFVWQSIQQIAPNLPPIKIEILKKPAS